MNKKLSILCFFSIFILMLSFYSPVISASSVIENQNTVQVKINNYIHGSAKKYIKELTVEDVKELKQTLQKYEKAIQENDYEQIAKCESWLKEKEVLTGTQLKILSILNKYQGSQTTTADGDILGSNCIFSATGEGFMLFPVETEIINWIQKNIDQQDSVIAGFVLMLLLLVLFYLPVMLVTHLIPFRIAMPHSQVDLKSGTMKVGDQDITSPIKVNLSSFTGITISTPKFSSGNESDDDSSGGFLFVKGYAGKVEEVET